MMDEETKKGVEKIRNFWKSKKSKEPKRIGRPYHLKRIIKGNQTYMVQVFEDEKRGN